jgi:hypothetical protein
MIKVSGRTNNAANTKFIMYYNGASTFNGVVSIANTSAANATSTGALKVSGGVGIGGNLYLGGYFNTGNIVNITSTNVANSTSTGALRVSGGAGIGGNLFLGGKIVLNSASYGTNDPPTSNVNTG